MLNMFPFHPVLFFFSDFSVFSQKCWNLSFFTSRFLFSAEGSLKLESLMCEKKKKKNVFESHVKKGVVLVLFGARVCSDNPLKWWTEEAIAQTLLFISIIYLFYIRLHCWNVKKKKKKSACVHTPVTVPLCVSLCVRVCVCMLPVHNFLWC